ncbi:hypothetical protein GOP47_0010804 [Adiantum capillus-veneris]|uniref:Ubiquitin-like domain-containing protein n=1 Tax=Adiantum capillus-veneris TaxID=13818 RepID=A0A9D4ZGQ1_ADICA|nr:hypothetical protein GOP47_0010804 [Adiantum capillus-veneris]
MDVEADQPVEKMKALLERRTGIAAPSQRLLQLHVSTSELPNSYILHSAGIAEGDVLILGVPVRAPNPDREHHLQQQQQEAELAFVMNADPFYVEAQRIKEANIQQKNIHDNWLEAMEHYPEVFAKENYTSLFVDMVVNDVPVKACVDSGAAISTMSYSWAERCGLLRLLDTSYAGFAVGVGVAPILGRVHAAPIELEGRLYLSSFIVLEHLEAGILLGLDMMRRHQCIIDLKDNVLRVGNGSQAFDVPLLLYKYKYEGDLAMEEEQINYPLFDPRLTMATPPASSHLHGYAPTPCPSSSIHHPYVYTKHHPDVPHQKGLTQPMFSDGRRTKLRLI